MWLNFSNISIQVFVMIVVQVLAFFYVSELCSG